MSSALSSVRRAAKNAASVPIEPAPPKLGAAWKEGGAAEGSEAVRALNAERGGCSNAVREMRIPTTSELLCKRRDVLDS